MIVGRVTCFLSQITRVTWWRLKISQPEMPQNQKSMYRHEPAGVALQQNTQEEWEPLAFSRKFSNIERRYLAYDREFLFCTEQFRHFRTWWRPEISLLITNCWRTLFYKSRKIIPCVNFAIWTLSANFQHISGLLKVKRTLHPTHYLD